jgi:hypothetical protein
MHATVSPLSTGRLLKVVLTAVLAATLSLLATNPANAAFPGSNGK